MLDLNADLAEHDDPAHDAALLPYLTSCNVAAGFHAGGPWVLERTVRAALDHGVTIGAHPAYDDRAHFGRRSLDVPRAQLLAQLRYQIAAVRGVVASLGGRLHHVKAHGALYNDMNRDADLARAVMGLVREMDPALKIYALAHSHVVTIGAEMGVTVVAEGFADRQYAAVDALRSRKLDGAVLTDPEAVLAQVAGFLDGTVVLHDGTRRPIALQTLCLHGDTPDALRLSREIYRFLTARGVRLGRNV